MGSMVRVGMAEYKIVHAPDSLTTIGLGSCIGVALYDPSTKIGGLAHIMLPSSTEITHNEKRAKFADTGIQDMYDDILKEGAIRGTLVAKIAGGARMFGFDRPMMEQMNIGDRNADACKQKLKELGVRLLSEDTGLNYGRTVELYTENGDYIIKAVGKPQITI